MARKNGNDSVVAGRYIDFLGYNFYIDNVRMRKSMKKRFARKAKRTKSEVKRQQVLASYWGCANGEIASIYGKQ